MNINVGAMLVQKAIKDYGWRFTREGGTTTAINEHTAETVTFDTNYQFEQWLLQNFN